MLPYEPGDTSMRHKAMTDFPANIEFVEDTMNYLDNIFDIQIRLSLLNDLAKIFEPQLDASLLILKRMGKIISETTQLMPLERMGYLYDLKISLQEGINIASERYVSREFRIEEEEMYLMRSFMSMKQTVDSDINFWEQALGISSDNFQSSAAD